MTKSAFATALLFAFALSAMGAQPNAGTEELKLKLPVVGEEKGDFQRHEPCHR